MILSITVEPPSAQDEPARRMGPRPAGRPPHAGGPGRSTVVWQKTASGGENSPKSERLRCERPSFVRKAPGRRFCGNDGEGARAARPSDFGGFSPRGRALCETGVDTNRCLPNLEPSLPWSGAGQGSPRLTGKVLPGEPAWPLPILVQHGKFPHLVKIRANRGFGGSRSFLFGEKSQVGVFQVHKKAAGGRLKPPICPDFDQLKKFFCTFAENAESDRAKA